MSSARCCACFETKLNLLSCFDEKSRGITIASIINQHLDIKITKNDGNLPKHVCGECWIKILNFHNFYQSVQDAKEIFLKALGVSHPGPSKSSERRSIQTNRNQKTAHYLKTEEVFSDEEFLQNDDDEDETFEYVLVKAEDDDQDSLEFPTEISIEIDQEKKDEDNQRFECDICKRTYPKIKTLKSHILSVHVGQQRQCELCNATLKSEEQLKKHMKNIHSGKLFICEQCPKQFKTREAMDRHRHIHTNEPFPQIVCPECGIIMDNVKYKGHKSLHKRQRERAERPKESNDETDIEIPEELLRSDSKPIAFVMDEQIFRVIQKQDSKRKRSVCEIGWADELKDAICRYSTLPCIFSFRTCTAGTRFVKCKGDCRECRATIFVWSPRQKMYETHAKVFNFNPNIEHKKKYIRIKMGRSEIIQRLLNNESPSSIRKSLKSQYGDGSGREPPNLISANALRILKHRLMREKEMNSQDESIELMEVVDEPEEKV